MVEDSTFNYKRGVFTRHFSLPTIAGFRLHQEPTAFEDVDIDPNVVNVKLNEFLWR